MTRDAGIQGAEAPQACGAWNPGLQSRIPAELRHLLHQRRGHVEVLLARHEEDGVDVDAEPAVHVRQLELVLEVGERAQAADDDRRAAAPAVVGQQALKRVDLQPRVAAQGIDDQPAALLIQRRRSTLCIDIRSVLEAFVLAPGRDGSDTRSSPKVNR